MLKFIWGDMNSQKYGSIGAWYIQYKSTQNLQVTKAINNIYHFATNSRYIHVARICPKSYDDFSEKFNF